MYENYFGDAGIYRFEQDVLCVPGISHCIFALGTNDIGYLGTELDDKKQGLRFRTFVWELEELVARARQKGIYCIYMPIFPRMDVDFTEEKEWMRRMVNEEVKRQKFFDEVMEMDSVLLNLETGTMKARFVQEDGLHLNEKGGEAVAQNMNIKIQQ